MIGIILVILGVAAAAYLILKRFYAPWALFMVGFVLCALMSFLSDAPIVTGKSATHTQTFDLIQIFTNLLKSRAAGLGMNLMIVGGFAYYMDKIGATAALVRVCTKPLSYIKAPYFLLAVAYVVGQILNIFIPSATGLGMLLMVTIFPLVVAMGVSKYSAAAIVVTASALDLGPASGNSILAAELSNEHVMEYFFSGQLPIAFVMVPVCAIAHGLIQRWFDRRDLAAGRIKEDDFRLPMQVDAKGAAIQPNAPAYYALLPILPVVLLFVFSKFVIAGVRLELVTAMIFCCVIGWLVDLLTRRKFKEVCDDTKAIFQGMGKIFGSTVMLVIAAEFFAEGLKRTGGIETLLNYAASIENAGGVAMLLAMFLIMGIAAFVTGSGNAAFFAFSRFIPDCAKSVGWEAVTFAAPVQLASGIARSMSPISGVMMAVSGLADVSPFEVARRTIPVMALGLVATFFAALLFV